MDLGLVKVMIDASITDYNSNSSALLCQF